ncbi:MAG: 4-(cytidine 5'-diphospho)-2-C-methyl-D-erythritol kinase [Marinosulfonomonas sp.]|nr:4-(cytidine 5'-diphospho)-2-C-methyl-D-erythritol kinase [Marinosulfonomonas sp.]
MTVKAFAPAKINLTLHVTGQREDGYHLLDSFVVFPRIGDDIVVSKSDRLSLRIEGQQAADLLPDSDNLVVRAARMLDPNGCADILLHKRLPVAAGIGGGSADAAATFHALEKLWGCAAPLIEEMAKLGADIPVCYPSTSSRMQGIGERLSPVQKMPDNMGIVLINPRSGVATSAVFDALETKNNAPMSEVIPEFSTAKEMCNWLKNQRNDLQKPAIKIAPVIADVLSDLEDTDCLIARMSGSGATCFGLYETEHEASAAAKLILADHPKWWVASSGF